MARATSAESAERVDQLQGMILAVQPYTACLTYARQAWGVSRSQGYRLIKRAWRQIHDDIEGTDLDRQEMLAWCVQTLIETAGQAKAQRNPGAVVAAIRQLDWMCGLGINSHRGYGVNSGLLAWCFANDHSSPNTKAHCQKKNFAAATSNRNHHHCQPHKQKRLKLLRHQFHKYCECRQCGDGIEIAKEGPQIHWGARGR